MTEAWRELWRAVADAERWAHPARYRELQDAAWELAHWLKYDARILTGQEGGFWWEHEFAGRP